jgi:hypothetical protein
LISFKDIIVLKKQLQTQIYINNAHEKRLFLWILTIILTPGWKSFSEAADRGDVFGRRGTAHINSICEHEQENIFYKFDEKCLARFVTYQTAPLGELLTKKWLNYPESILEEFVCRLLLNAMLEIWQRD